MVNKMGYPPSEIRYCPRCGSRRISANTWWESDGKLTCRECGLVCYIVEGDDSQAKESEDESE